MRQGHYRKVQAAQSRETGVQDRMRQNCRQNRNEAAWNRDRTNLEIGQAKSRKDIVRQEGGNWQYQDMVGDIE